MLADDAWRLCVESDSMDGRVLLKLRGGGNAFAGAITAATGGATSTGDSALPTPPKLSVFCVLMDEGALNAGPIVRMVL